MKVIKKVEEFDAVQWRPGKQIEGVEVEYFQSRDTHYKYYAAGVDVYYGEQRDSLRAFLVTKDARVRVYNGDWIITDSEGRKSVCPKAEFDQEYERRSCLDEFHVDPILVTKYLWGKR